MLYNILNSLFNQNISKIILIGTILYILIFIFLYTKYVDKFEYIKQYRKYIIYIAIIDLALLFVVKRKDIIDKCKNNKNKHTLINNFSDSETETQFNPYHKNTEQNISPFIQIHNDTESDIEFPIYKQKQQDKID